MYRAFTWAVLEHGLDPQNIDEACSLVRKNRYPLTKDGEVFVTKPMSRAKSENHVSLVMSSYIASYKPIRLALVDQQRALAKNHSVVWIGRDIGTLRAT